MEVSDYPKSAAAFAPSAGAGSLRMRRKDFAACAFLRLVWGRSWTVTMMKRLN